VEDEIPAIEPNRFYDEQVNDEKDRDDPEKSQYYPFQPVIALRDYKKRLPRSPSSFFFIGSAYPMPL
jgi:hypothetical protein